MAGIRLPLESKPLQALVSEPVKPIIDTVVMSNAVHAYVSQSDKGELVIGAGTARHDAVAWGYARGADEMGVDIIQNCEVKGIKRNGDSVEGIETTKGFIKTKKIGVVAAGHSSVIASMAGIRLPLESKPLQALVSEPVKPIIDTVVMSNAVHAYVSQSDKGELVIGAGTDASVPLISILPSVEASKIPALSLAALLSLCTA